MRHVRLSDAFTDTFALGQRLPNAEGGCAQLIQRFVRLPGRLDARLCLDADDLARLKRPTLLIAGREDFLGGLAYARELASAILMPS